mmetsp:Transcript_78569/g.244149  ORF Transcript_78569/g.244149 Transcript_78569/m.244149 type:complete len:384 (+) Transcript_78569:78-1229(+)
MAAAVEAGVQGSPAPEPWDAPSSCFEDALDALHHEQVSALSCSMDAALDPAAPDPDSSQALIAAREQLATVSEELAFLQRQLDCGPAGDEPPVRGAHTAAHAGDSRAARALEVQLRHLEVDRDEANTRAARLAKEKDGLQAVQLRLEAELHDTRRSLAETRRHLRHRELDLQQYTGHVPADLEPSSPGSGSTPKADMPQELAQPASPIKDDGFELPAAWAASTRSRVTDLSRTTGSTSKQQILASLRAAQAELREERLAREKLERRVRKDRERMEGLVALAERQRSEIGLLRRRGDLFEAYAWECERKLKQNSAQPEVLSPGAEGVGVVLDASMIEGALAAEAAKPQSPFGGRGPAQAGLGAAQLARQHSAPTRLPSVARGRS